MEGPDYTNHLVINVAPDTSKEAVGGADSGDDDSASNIYDDIYPSGAQRRNRAKSTDEPRTETARKQKRGVKQYSGFLLHEPTECLHVIKRPAALLCALLVVLFLMWILLLTLMLVKDAELSEKLKTAELDRSAMKVNNAKLSEKLKTAELDRSAMKANISRAQADCKMEHEAIRARLDQDLAAIRASTEPLHKCPEEWKKHGASCYYFSPSDLPWGAARESCLSHNADLVIVDNHQEQGFLAQNLNSKIHWIGLSDAASEGDWRWVSGLPVVLSSWHKGEPNNVGEEDCAVIQDSQWNDIPCSTNTHWICEKGLF